MGSSVRMAENHRKRWDFQGFGANLMPNAEGHLGNVGLKSFPISFPSLSIDTTFQVPASPPGSTSTFFGGSANALPGPAVRPARTTAAISNATRTMLHLRL